MIISDFPDFLNNGLNFIFHKYSMVSINYDFNFLNN